MKCPSCSENVADDAAICPKCDDAVLDASLFDNKPPEEDGPTEPEARPLKSGPSVIAPGAKRPLPKRPPGSGVPPPRRPAGGPGPNSSPRQKAGATGQGMPDAPGRKVREAPKQPAEDWRVKMDTNRAAPPREPSGGYNRMTDPEDFWGDVKHFFLDLTLADKLASLGAFGALVSCFFPWKDTITEGDILGLMSLGAAVFVVSLVVIVAIVIRVRKVMPALHALIPWLLQFGGACFCIVWCLVYVKLSWDSTMARSPIGNFERWVSSPSPGVFIALLMSVMALGGTLMGLKEKPPS